MLLVPMLAICSALAIAACNKDSGQAHLTTEPDAQSGDQSEVQGRSFTLVESKYPGPFLEICVMDEDPAAHSQHFVVLPFTAGLEPSPWCQVFVEEGLTFLLIELPVSFFPEIEIEEPAALGLGGNPPIAKPAKPSKPIAKADKGPETVTAAEHATAGTWNRQRMKVLRPVKPGDRIQSQDGSQLDVIEAKGVGATHGTLHAVPRNALRPADEAALFRMDAAQVTQIPKAKEANCE